MFERIIYRFIFRTFFLHRAVPRTRKYRLLRLIPVLLLTAAGGPAAAQFHTVGDDPGRLRWERIDAPHYRLIYPRGLDSLARRYATLLERYRTAVSLSTGFEPGCGYRSRTPVILHAWHGVSNASVTWAPRRMDFFTVPDAYEPDPYPWAKSLAIHESRHLSQMQLGYAGRLKPLSRLLGDLVPGAASALYPNVHLLEGDAVVAETALTRYGRGRSAAFLDYYSVAFDNGDLRNWYRWRYGSYRYPAPDHYALGYLTLAGVRCLWDDPLFMQRYLEGAARHPLRLSHLRKQVKATSGLPFDDAFAEIVRTFHADWAQRAALRGPFTTARPVAPKPDWYTAFGGSVHTGEGIWSIRSHALTPPTLIWTQPDGRQEEVRPFSARAGGLHAGTDGRLWWSEAVPHPRWSLEMSVRIRCRDRNGAIRDLTRQGRLYHPVPLAGDTALLAVEYPVAGGSALVTLSASDGSRLDRLPAPDSVQLVEPAQVAGRILVSGISEAGYGLYEARPDGLHVVLAPRPVSLHALRGAGSRLIFCSDRSGVSEIYALDLPPEDGRPVPQTDRLRQLTASRYGATDPAPSPSGDSLYFSLLSPDGRLLYKQPLSADDGRTCAFSEVAPHPFADRLTRQERQLSAAAGIPWADSDSTFSVPLSDPVPYRKLPHLLHIHSWAPLYINYDAISTLSADALVQSALPGFILFTQNHLGTAYGAIGYSWNWKSGLPPGLRHGVHARFTYSGLLPVIEARVDLGGRAATQYIRWTNPLAPDRAGGTLTVPGRKPAFSASLQAYVPLNFSSGGWRRGLVPLVQYRTGNSLFSEAEIAFPADGPIPTELPVDYANGRIVLLQTLDASLRGYVVQSTPASLSYPKWGIGAEAGWHGRLNLTDRFSPSAYGYLYGYVPGLVAQHGLRLTATAQRQFGPAGITGENSLSVRPRGFSVEGLGALLGRYARQQLRLTADYAIPVFVGDISCFSPLLYIRNFELRPHLDWAAFSLAEIPSRLPEGKAFLEGGLMSAGTEIHALLAHFLWFPFDSRIGVRFGWNGGPSYGLVRQLGADVGRTYVEMLFNMSI